MPELIYFGVKHQPLGLFQNVIVESKLIKIVFTSIRDEAAVAVYIRHYNALQMLWGTFLWLDFTSFLTLWNWTEKSVLDQKTTALVFQFE